ncbi:MAG: tRNA glutamyl-Q(34) synthetase GluQRS [Aeriscardovia sp.]|nr:tRNA glutamyl-Q(34) synthetase GluQRS [Aeriscardovia sp.]
MLSSLQNLPSTGRFAPSPTGKLHIGNVYTALGAYLGARRFAHSRFILRIEDLDTSKDVRAESLRIIKDLEWLGFDWDEVVFQSQRLDIYEEALKEIRALNPEDPLLYPCSCSRKEICAQSPADPIDGMRVYGGKCRKNPPSALQGCSLRLKAPHFGRDRRIEVKDFIFGPKIFDLEKQIGDAALKRRDGQFSYQLAVAVDDGTEGIGQVVRGRDLLKSSALQIYIRRLLGLEDLRFTHLPLILENGGMKMSKSHRSVDVSLLREWGASPRQVIGFCAWLMNLYPAPRPAPMGIEECVQLFSYKKVKFGPNRLNDVELPPYFSDPHWWRGSGGSSRRIE